MSNQAEVAFIFCEHVTLLTVSFMDSLQFSLVQLLSHVWLFATPGLQHAKPPCPPQTHRGYSNSCPLIRWCHPTISSSVVPFSSLLQYFPALGSFFRWISSSHQVAKVLKFQLQHQSFQWIIRTDFLQDLVVGSLQSKGLSRVFSNTIVQKRQFFSAQLSDSPTLTPIHDYWKNHSFD